MVNELQTAIIELRKLPKVTQKTVAQAIMDYTKHGTQVLSDKQAAEVARRMKRSGRKFISVAQARARLRTLGV